MIVEELQNKMLKLLLEELTLLLVIMVQNGNVVHSTCCYLI